MHQRDQLFGRHRRLFAHQDLEALILQRLFNRAACGQAARDGRAG